METETALEFDLFEYILNHINDNKLIKYIKKNHTSSNNTTNMSDRFQEIIFFGITTRLCVHPLFKFAWTYRFPGLSWSSILVSKYGIRDFQTVEDNPRFPWRYGSGGLSSNQHLTIEWLRRAPSTAPWEFGRLGLSSCPEFRMTWRDEYPHSNWDFRTISRCSAHISPETVHNFPRVRWSFASEGLIYNSNFGIQWLQALPNANWDWLAVQMHPKFDVHWIQYIPPDELRMFVVSTAPLFEPIWIRENPDLPWPKRALTLFWLHPGWVPGWCDQVQDITGVKLTQISWLEHNIYHPVFPIHFNINWIQQNPIISWNWGKGGISSHQHFDIEWVRRYPNRAWYFGQNGISSAPKLQLDWILEFPNKPWSKKGIFENVNVCFNWLRPLASIGITMPSHIQLRHMTDSKKKYTGDYALVNNRRRLVCELLCRLCTCSISRVQEFLPRRVMEYLTQ